MPEVPGEQVAPGVFEVGSRLEELTPSARVSGVVGAGEVTVVAVEWHGTNALTLTYRDGDGRLGEVDPLPRPRAKPEGHQGLDGTTVRR